MTTDYAALADRINRVEWDSVFRINAGSVVDVPGAYAPEVYHDESDDIAICGEGWECLTGLTGQYGYNGAVIHPSEFIGTRIAERLADMSEDSVVFAIVVVYSLDEEDDSDSVVGWAIAYRYL